MLDLVKYVVLQFAEKKDAIEFVETEKGNVTTITVRCHLYKDKKVNNKIKLTLFFPFLIS